MKNIIYMKYGVHASESVDDIISRKQLEEENVGYALWGYGGTFCHPINQIQEFAKNGESIYVVMSYTPSQLNNEPKRSEYYSIDKMNWEKMPKDINVLGSKYALVIKNLKKCDIHIDLSEYEVPIGNSKSKLLSEHIRYRVDKSCGIKTDKKGTEKLIHITLIAELQSPFAVFLK